jgi:RHS repeat-associated protein
MVNKYAYDEFGNLQNSVEAVSNPFLYVGQFGVMDEDKGVFYMRARYYDPEVGRFISKDPIGFLGGDVNFYACVQNNPINWVDPLGLLTCTYSITTHSLHCINIAGQPFYTPEAASGLGTCKNNLACVSKEDRGPIPPGRYIIHPPGYSPNRPGDLYLRPAPGTNLLNRKGGFFIHLWGTSKGCIMLHMQEFDIISGWATQDQGGALYVIP